MKGVPASPLRFDPGTPFLDQHITDVYGEARCRVVNGSERAAVSREWKATTKRAAIGASSLGRDARRRIVQGREDDEADGCGGRQTIGRAGRRPRAGMSDETSTAASRGAALAFRLWLLGRSSWRSTPWRRASLPAGAGGPAANHRCVQSACALSTLPGFLGVGLVQLISRLSTLVSVSSNAASSGSEGAA
jgi:hypothetical protein